MKRKMASAGRVATMACAALLTTGGAHAAFWEGFDAGTGPDRTKWEVANWANGDIFGCTFAYSEAYLVNWGSLVLNVNASNQSSVKCGEIRTYQSFTYGKFVTRLQPSYIKGANTSFFLFTGTPGTSSHYEIDIEFIRGGTVIHTNVWKNGQQNYLQFGTANGWQTIGFEWRPSYIRWFHVNSNGSETEFRRVNVSISTPMRLMMNHWVGNNSAGAQSFLGYYTPGTGGPAYYDWVRVDN